jgi:hypothetical protein
MMRNKEPERWGTACGKEFYDRAGEMDILAAINDQRLRRWRIPPKIIHSFSEAGKTNFGVIEHMKRGMKTVQGPHRTYLGWRGVMV